LERLIAEAAHEALKLLVVFDAEGEDWDGHTGPEGVPYTVALPTNRGGPTHYAYVRNQQLVPAANELVNFKPEVVGRM
jgi:hypothetical protein